MPERTFKIIYRVSWVDTDAAGVVHFSNYFRFFEKAEEEFYQHLGFSFESSEVTKGLWFPRVEAFSQYKRPAKYNDLLEIELTVEEVKEKTVKYGFSVFKKETSELLANGYLVIVAADKKLGKATRIPKEIVEKLKPYTK
jgi:acyl-CoA thioester hydrolase